MGNCTIAVVQIAERGRSRCAGPYGGKGERRAFYSGVRLAAARLGARQRRRIGHGERNEAKLADELAAQEA